MWDEAFVIASWAAAFVEPGEDVLDHPASAHQLKAFGVRMATDDVEMELAGGHRACASKV